MGVVMASEGWKNSHSFYGKVFTSSKALPNGWTASVTDCTQASAPFRGTYYTVQANCRFWGVGHPERFKMLEDARAAAIEFTEKMPTCDDSASDGNHCRGAWDIRRAVIDEWNRSKSRG
jgi:hypothetical protein